LSALAAYGLIVDVRTTRIPRRELKPMARRVVVRRDDEPRGRVVGMRNLLRGNVLPGPLVSTGAGQCLFYSVRTLGKNGSISE